MARCPDGCSRFHMAQMATLETFVASSRGDGGTSARSNPPEMSGNFASQAGSGSLGSTQSTVANWKQRLSNYLVVIIFINGLIYISTIIESINSSQTFFNFRIHDQGDDPNWHIKSSSVQFWPLAKSKPKLNCFTWSRRILVQTQKDVLFEGRVKVSLQVVIEKNI